MLIRIMTSWDGTDVGPDPDGFVHLSSAEQVAGTVQRHHAVAPALVFLVLDEAALPASALRFEDTGHGRYPHLYATLPAAAVSAAVRWERGEPIPALDDASRRGRGRPARGRADEPTS